MAGDGRHGVGVAGVGHTAPPYTRHLYIYIYIYIGINIYTGVNIFGGVAGVGGRGQGSKVRAG